jgi:hypothetical protein
MKLTAFILLMALPFTAATTPAIALDDQAPSVEIQGEPGFVNSTAAFVVAAVFSEVVNGFINSGVSVGNAEVIGFSSTDDITYSIEIKPSGAGDISIDIAAGVAEDMQLNGNSAAQQVQVDFDATPPGVDILDVPAVTVNSLAPFDISVEFSEFVYGFIDTDITIVNATVTPFTPEDGAVFRVQITPDGSGDIRIDIAAGVAQDNAGNGNSASQPIQIAFDATPPGVDILDVPTTVNSLAPFDISVEFSEFVYEFTDTDITIRIKLNIQS